jgi:predicted Holliday junction resolvase-like endonuclease
MLLTGKRNEYWLHTGSAKSFVKQLLDERFAALLKQSPHLLANDTSYCVKDLLNSVQSETKQTISDDFPFEENAEKARQSIEECIRSFKKVKIQQNRDIWLGNLCEQLAFTVTDIRHVVRFLVDFVQC